MSMTADLVSLTGELDKEIAAVEAAIADARDHAQAEAGEANARALLALSSGIHLDVPEAVYHARVLGMASKSGLDQLRRTPAHYRAWVDGLLDRDTSALHLGKAVHCAVLEPERFARQYVIAPDFGDCRKRDNKLARDAWRRENRGAIILRNEDGIATLGMIRALSAHPLVSALLEGSSCEITARWDDPETGVPCKARADIFAEELATLADIKSTTDASPAAFARDAWNYGYHRQDPFYRDGFSVAGQPVEGFVFIVAEKTPPHAVALYELDAAARERGERENRVLLERLARCVERDEWPSYPDGIESLSLPRWAEKASLT